MSFTLGGAGMASELLASRLLAPYIGTSMIVWTALIGTVLLALAAGYAAGGRYADRGAGPRSLVMICLGTATAIASIVPVSHPLARFASGLGDERLSALTAACGLLLLPNFCLAFASPIMMRLAAGTAPIGRSVGGVQASAAVGSVIGTFVFGFWLVSLVPIQQLILALACVVAASALPLLWPLLHRRRPLERVLAPILLFAPLGIGAIDFFPHEAIQQISTQEQQYWLFDTVEAETNRPKRVLKSGRRGYQAQRYLDGQGGTPMRYLAYFDLDRQFVPKMKRVLMIGGGGYVYPSQLTVRNPGLDIDIVEVDGGLEGVARQFFDWHPQSNVRQFVGDGRVFLNQAQSVYDLVYVDAFNDIDVPFQLLTKEFFSVVRQRLTADGACFLNFIASTDAERDVLVGAIHATMASVFPSVVALPHQPGTAAAANITFIGLKNADAATRPVLDPRHVAMLKTPLKTFAPAPVLVDALAPVEFLAKRFF